MTIKIILAILLLAPFGVSGQIMKALEKRNAEPFNWAEYEASVSDKEKIELLRLLPEGDTVQFNSYDGGLYPLDTAGLHYLDLDSDGDTDLIYQAMSGNMGRGSSKIYIQEEGTFVEKGIVSGWIRNINFEPQLEISSYEKPCCDSYTNSIRTYTLDGTISCTSNVVFIALAYGGLKGFPVLQTKDRRSTNSANFYISPIDLRSGGYFRDRTKEIHAELRSGKFVMCGKIPDGSEVAILDSIMAEDKKWYLAISDPISKPDSSLFEDWQTRFIKKSRYLGWVNEDGITVQR